VTQVYNAAILNASVQMFILQATSVNVTKDCTELKKLERLLIEKDFVLVLKLGVRPENGATTLSIATLSMTTLSLTTLSMTTFSITTNKARYSA
jgi:hypothetical protein